MLWDQTPEKVGPFDGGCLALARALERLGGQVVVLVDQQGLAHHAVARFGRWLVDFNGAFRDEKMLEKFSLEEMATVVAVREIRDGDLAEAYENDELVEAIVDAIGQQARQRLVDLMRVSVPARGPGR